jgi:hypothetical protein
MFSPEVTLTIGLTMAFSLTIVLYAALDIVSINAKNIVLDSCFHDRGNSACLYILTYHSNQVIIFTKYAKWSKDIDDYELYSDAELKMEDKLYLPSSQLGTFVRIKNPVPH